MPSNGNHTLTLLSTAKHMLVLHIFELLLADCVDLDYAPNDIQTYVFAGSASVMLHRLAILAIVSSISHFNKVLHDPGILPGSAYQCILGNVYLSSDLPSKGLHETNQVQSFVNSAPSKGTRCCNVLQGLCDACA